MNGVVSRNITAIGAPVLKRSLLGELGVDL